MKSNFSTLNIRIFNFKIYLTTKANHFWILQNATYLNDYSFNLNNLCINNKRKLHNLMKMTMNKDYNNKEPEHIFNVQTHLK